VYVAKGLDFPVQIVESKQLSERENLWLYNLRNNINAESLTEVLKAVIKRGKSAELPAYLNVLLAANPKTIKEVEYNMMTAELREVLIDIGFAAEWEAQGEARGEERGIEKGREKGLEEGRELGRLWVARNALKRGNDPTILRQ
jgi:predicted transposase YdaD